MPLNHQKNESYKPKTLCQLCFWDGNLKFSPKRFESWIYFVIFTSENRIKIRCVVRKIISEKTANLFYILFRDTQIEDNFVRYIYVYLFFHANAFVNNYYKKIMSARFGIKLVLAFFYRAHLSTVVIRDCYIFMAQWAEKKIHLVIRVVRTRE